VFKAHLGVFTITSALLADAEATTNARISVKKATYQ